MRFSAIFLFIATLTIAVSTAAPAARAQDAPAHSMHDGMDMSMPMDDTPDTPAVIAKRLADKRESEFNHHLAGFFVVLAGLFILAEPSLRQRAPWVRYAWPVCFLLSGLFLMVFSDTELWPFGPQSWAYGLSHSAEDVQHKTFAVILLILGVVEFQRARGAIKAAWTGWIFPVLAVAGSILVLFHEHHGGMHGADHMTTMARIKSEHLSYAIAGIGIGLSKGLSEVPSTAQRLFAKLWPSLMIVLGVLLMFYRE